MAPPDEGVYLSGPSLTLKHSWEKMENALLAMNGIAKENPQFNCLSFNKTWNTNPFKAFLDLI